MTYDAIIFLNNAAVKLLENDLCARESVVTFRDAMYVQRLLYSQRAQQTRSISSHCDDFENIIIPTTLRKATKSLCNIPRKTTKTRFPLDEERLVTLSFMDDDCFTKLLKYKSFLDQIDVVFRIDHEADNGEYKCEKRNWELNSAILLYNYALGCKRAAQDYHHVRSNEKNCKLLEESMTFFQFAYDIVMIELELFSIRIKERRGHSKDELESILRIIMIAMFVSIQLSHISYHYFNMSQQGDEYYNKYEKLSVLFSTIVQQYQSHPVTLAKHAAAA